MSVCSSKSVFRECVTLSLTCIPSLASSCLTSHRLLSTLLNKPVDC